MKNNLFLLIFLLMVFSCGRQEKNVALKNSDFLKLKVPKFSKLKNYVNNPIQYSKLIDTSFNVKLETKKECIIGGIDKILIFNQRIFILDIRKSNGVFEFGMNGEFIRKYGREGRGPGEYTNISSFEIDKARKELIIYDWGKKSFIYFSFDGNYIREQKIGTRFNDFALIGDQYIFDIHNIRSKSKKKFDIAFATRNGKVERILPQEKSIKDLLASNNLGFDEKSILFSEPYSNKIFRLEKGEFKPFLEISFSDKKIPDNFFNQSDFPSFLSKISSEELSYFNSNVGYGYNKGVLIFTCNKGRSSATCLYSFKTERIYPINILSNSEGEYVLTGFPIGDAWYNDYFISYLHSDWILAMKNKTKDEKSQEIIRNTKLTDNPVLFFNQIRKDI